MPTTAPIPAYVALGANVGDREGNLRAALAEIAATPGVAVVRVSAFYENPAVGMGEGAAAFLNAAARVDTTLSPHALLGRLLEIERGLGRNRTRKWEPRPIDLDLLLYGDQIVRTDPLTVPHPLMHERQFVLHPLTEIAPDAVHPVLQRTVQQLLAALIAGDPASNT